MKYLILIFSLFTFSPVFSAIFDQRCEEGSYFIRLEEDICHLEKIQTAILQNNAETPEERNGLFFLFTEKAHLIADADRILLESLQKRISLDDPLKEKKLLLVHALLNDLYQLKTKAEFGDFEKMKANLSSLKKTFFSPILRGSRGGKPSPPYPSRRLPCRPPEKDSE